MSQWNFDKSPTPSPSGILSVECRASTSADYRDYENIMLGGLESCKRLKEME
jgi:hypothetical protein